MTLATCATAGFWRIIVDNRAPNWDEASYLYRAVTGLEDVRPPGANYLLWIPATLEGSTGYSLDVYAGIIWLLALAATALLGRSLLPLGGAVLVTAVTATSCTYFTLSSRILVDLPLAVSVTLTVTAAIQMTKNKSWTFAVITGAGIGFSLLIKPTALTFIAPAMLVVATLDLADLWFQFPHSSGDSRTAPVSIRPRVPGDWRSRTARWLLTCALGAAVAATWYIPNFAKVMSYYRVADGPTDNWFRLAPSDVGSLRAYKQFIDLVTSAGLGHLAFASVAIGFVVGATVVSAKVACASSLMLRRKLHRFALGRELRMSLYASVPATTVGIALSVPAIIVFGGSNFWEIRYLAPAIVGLALILAAITTALPTSWASPTAAVVLLGLWLPQATVLASSPSSWPRNVQAMFYGSPTRLAASNTWLSAARAGLEPTIDADRSRTILDALPLSNARTTKLGILMTHPEANKTTLKWGAYVAGKRLDVIEIPTSRLAGEKIVPIPDTETLLRAECMNYVIAPIIPLDHRDKKSDYVEWLNFYFYKSFDIASIAERDSVLNLSEPRAVATEDTIQYELWRIKRPLQCSKTFEHGADRP